MYKKTEICNVCAKLKNVCQTCVLDLQFGLPSQILDQALPNSVKMPESEANREYFMDQADTMVCFVYFFYFNQLFIILIRLLLLNANEKLQLQTKC